MPRFLLEVEHESEAIACARAVRALLASGSHFLTHVDWGCKDGVHSGWVIVEVDDKAAARAIVPPALRSRARIVALNGFTMEQVDEILKFHQR
jgi:hypothetical protein